MVGVLSGLLMLLLPAIYWRSRPAVSRPTRYWRVLYSDKRKHEAHGPTWGDRLFVVAWHAVAVVALVRGATDL